jgi:hypothetical protein
VVLYIVGDILLLLTIGAIQLIAWRSTGFLSTEGKLLAIAAALFLPFVVGSIVLTVKGNVPPWLFVAEGIAIAVCIIWFVLWDRAPQILFSSLRTPR